MGTQSGFFLKFLHNPLAGKRLDFVAGILAAMLLVGCGGGGGGGEDGGGGSGGGSGGGGGGGAPGAVTLTLTPASVKLLRFSWSDVSGETEYQLLENPDGTSGFIQVATIAADATTHDHAVFLPARVNASYMLRSCNSAGCTDSAAVAVSGALAAAVGYIKASNTEAEEEFGTFVALSADGNTLAVGAETEDGAAAGVNGNEADNSAFHSGAVYVYTRVNNAWSKQAYIKASNPTGEDHFGERLALSGDGNTLAVGAIGEDSNATGINGDQANELADTSGAVYVYTRSGNAWSQQAYIKASNTGAGDQFGYSIGLSSDGNTLAVSALGEDSNATGINGAQADNSAGASGAVYVYARSGATWAQQAYVKASNTAAADQFGSALALSGDGNTLAVGAIGEDSNATGINGSQTDNSSLNSGAVYVFARSGSAWSQQAYVKSSNTGVDDQFGFSLALSADSNTLAVGAISEDGSATGINGNVLDDLSLNSGAVYVFARSGSAWSQQAYVKASNTGAGDQFGYSLGLSADGNVLAVGAIQEDSDATGINGNAISDSASASGAAYVYGRTGADWTQQAYIKASNTGADDQFGFSIGLAGNGGVLAVGASGEDSNATGINGNQTNNSAAGSGAVYLY